jgi:dTDP-4-amino-4,6-dideoxygalactose transaminase
MNIPFVDLRKQYLSIKEEVDRAIFEVIENTAFIGGKHVEEFERNFEKIYNIKHCISVANGTDSLYIIMKMLNIGPGDEVITVANSWISSSETISQTGARPVFVDIDPTYYTIDETKIEKFINKNTKAIIPVHIHGQICNMEKIIEIGKKFNLPVIEDCAQSHFSEFNGKYAGTFGIAGSFSFYPGKNLGAYGDAGCIITNDDDLALKCRMFARHGALKKHNHLMEGVNSRMDGLQAAILNVKLNYIHSWTNSRIEKAQLYNEFLKNINGIVIPQIRENSKHTFHLYVIRTKLRDELMSFLKHWGIECAIHYPLALPNMPAYKYLDYNEADFPVSSLYQKQILSLPIYPEISSDQIKFISEKISIFFKDN